MQDDGTKPEAILIDCVDGTAIKRTLLTSTMLDFAMRSRAAGGDEQTSAALAIRYAPPADGGFLRGRYTRDGSAIVTWPRR